MNRIQFQRRSNPGPRHGARSLALWLAVVLVSGGGPVVAQPVPADCSLEHTGGSGPFDYRFDNVKSVERFHFTPKVEMLLSGQSTTHPGPDIGYMLHKSPNHHRALISLTRLGERLATDRVRDMRFSIECYFHRAVYWAPNDTVARMLFAQYLGKRGRINEANSQLNLVAHYAGDNPLTHYNIGLVAVEIKNFDLALKHAHIAYRSGVTQSRLREQLVSANRWIEPSEPAPAPGVSSPASAASAPR